MNRRALIIGTAVVLFSGYVQAQTAPAGLSPREAQAGLQAGRLLLIDIRTPAEWADTGVAQGALRLDAEAGGFEVRLAGLRLDHPAKRIALIDRTGGQAAVVQQALTARGWRDLVVVRGGMLGPGGWLAEKLPVAP